MRYISPETMQSQSVGIVHLIRISRRKAMSEFVMLERRFVSSHMDLVMLNFSFEFHTFLWTFDK